MSSSLSVSLASVQVILVRYVESILFVLGITGSLLNILLFSQRKLRANSCCICKYKSIDKLLSNNFL